MAQVMVNFRMDENVKKCMEQACREMGLSMTTAFTIFATKVGREKRIPFEITAEPYGPQSRRGRPREEEAPEEGPSPRSLLHYGAFHGAHPAFVRRRAQGQGRRDYRLRQDPVLRQER